MISDIFQLILSLGLLVVTLLISMVIFVLIIFIIISSISQKKGNDRSEEQPLYESFGQYLKNYKYPIIFFIVVILGGLITKQIIDTNVLSGIIRENTETVSYVAANFEKMVWQFVSYTNFLVIGLAFSGVVGILARYKLPSFLCYQIILIIIVFAVLFQ